jgi:hypothetical protein
MVDWFLEVQTFGDIRSQNAIMKNVVIIPLNRIAISGYMVTVNRIYHRITRDIVVYSLQLD